ncbi:MAG: hypothetical protein ACE5D7_05445, partial [Fidelibacterota bacterium]
MNNLIKESVSEEYDAATYYRQANTMLINTGFDAICLKGECPPLKPWNANEFPELANWLDNNNQILNLIKIGSEQKHYLRFIEEYEESWSLPTENFPDALYKYLLCHLGFTLSNDPGSSKIPEELAISLNLLNQLKSSMTLIRGIMAIAFERDLHLLLQSDLLEQTSTIDIYSTI